MSAAKGCWRFLLLALAANLLLAGSVGSGKALACSCASSKSPSERAVEDLREADVVFSGEAMEVDRSSTPSASGQSGSTSFRAEKFWKGEPSEGVVHDGGEVAAACGVAFREGESYLVYAYWEGMGEEARLQAGACDSTQPLPAAFFDLDVLGPPQATLPETGGWVPLVAAQSEAGSAALFLLAALGAGALYLRRGRGRDPR